MTVSQSTEAILPTTCHVTTYSTTRSTTNIQPVLNNSTDSKIISMLFLPEGEGRTGDGGLRAHGSFKQSLPDKPLITVITVVFNGRDHLERTIRSVIDQTYDNIEYLIIDAGSSDGTLDIIRKYEEQIDYWVSEKDCGVYFALNKGISTAFGEYVYILGSDDYLIDCHVIDRVASDINLMRCDALLYAVKTNSGILKPKGCPWFFFKNTIPHQGAFIRLALHTKFLYNTEYKVLADYDFFYKLLQDSYKIHYSDFIIAQYSVDGISGQGKLLNYLEECRIRKKHLSLITSSVLYFFSIARWLRKIVIHKFKA